jgi:type VI secretion system protein ImpE
MDARELFKADRIEEAVKAQTAAVKANPRDPEQRYLLVALLGFLGEWERAARQLDALGLDDDKLTAAGRVYRQLLAAEVERQAVFAEGHRPLVPPDPPAHLEARLRALAALREDGAKAASAELDAAVNAQPDLAGSVNGEPFAGLRDQDDRLGSVLEVFAGGHYLWLPLERVRRLEIEAPSHLLDLLWIPAALEDVEGAQATVHLPVLYEGSAATGRGELRRGRATDWEDLGGEIYRGLGQRVLAFGRPGGEPEELDLLSLRRLEVDAAGAGET